MLVTKKEKKKRTGTTDKVQRDAHMQAATELTWQGWQRLFMNVILTRLSIRLQTQRGTNKC